MNFDAETRIKKLEKACTHDLKKNCKILAYYRSGLEMIRQIDVYLKEKKLVDAYLLCFRFVILFVETLPKHPEYGSRPKLEHSKVRERLPIIMKRAEKLKPEVLHIFQCEHEDWLQDQAAKKEKENAIVPTEINNEPSATTIPECSPNYSYPNSIFTGGLREMLIPNTLINTFLKLAEKNTRNNIETCGLLTGVLERDRLIITLLLVPEQSGSADDCSAENDLDIFTVIDERELLTLGWIHTHPSQDAFLSSVDAHSQFGYQAMMPEAVAIVCAPKHTNEVFKLTDIGMEIIGKCTQSGFHPHSGPPLFEVASHAQFVGNPCDVVDLRVAK